MKLLIAIIAALALAPAALADVSVPTPVGTLNLSTNQLRAGQDGVGPAASSFDYSVSSTPLDPALYGANGDNIAEWVFGPGTDPSWATKYPGYINYQVLECSRVVLDVSVVELDSGWHCDQQDYLPQQASLSFLNANSPANDHQVLSGDGNENRSWFAQGDSLAWPDLGPFVGMPITGKVYSNVCTRIYLDVSHYPPGGESGTNNFTGCAGSLDPSQISLMDASACGKTACKPTAPPTGFKFKIQKRRAKAVSRSRSVTRDMLRRGCVANEDRPGAWVCPLPYPGKKSR